MAACDMLMSWEDGLPFLAVVSETSVSIERLLLSNIILPSGCKALVPVHLRYSIVCRKALLKVYHSTPQTFLQILEAVSALLVASSTVSSVLMSLQASIYTARWHSDDSA